jgi:hypothetical protein
MNKIEQRKRHTREQLNRLVTESRYVVNFNLHGKQHGAIKQRTGCDDESISNILKTQHMLIKELSHIRSSSISPVSKNRMLVQWSNNNINKIQNQVIWLGQCFLGRLRDFSDNVNKYCYYFTDLKKEILRLRKLGIYKPKIKQGHIQEGKQNTFEKWRTSVSQLSSHYKRLPLYADPLIKALELKLTCVKILYHNDKFKIQSVRDSLDAMRKLRNKLKRKFENPKLSLLGKNSYDIRSYDTMTGLCRNFIPEIARLYKYAVTTDKIYPPREQTYWKMKNIQAAPVLKKHRNLTANSYKIGTAMLKRRKSI